MKDRPFVVIRFKTQGATSTLLISMEHVANRSLLALVINGLFFKLPPVLNIREKTYRAI